MATSDGPAPWLLEQNDEWQLQHRDMTLETMAGRGDEPTTALLKAA